MCAFTQLTQRTFSQIWCEYTIQSIGKNSSYPKTIWSLIRDSSPP